MPPPPAPIGAERASQLTQKESYVFVIALNPSQLFLYPSYFVHCTHCEGVGESHTRSIPVWREFFSTLRILKGSASLAPVRSVARALLALQHMLAKETTPRRRNIFRMILFFLILFFGIKPQPWDK